MKSQFQFAELTQKSSKELFFLFIIETLESELTELKEKDACCPKDKKMEVEENKK
jgi:hypothetical protein